MRVHPGQAAQAIELISFTAGFLDYSNYVLDGDLNPTKNGGATPQSGTWEFVASADN